MERNELSILVGVDFSGTSLRAMAEAVRLSRKTGAFVHVVHVAASPVSAPVDVVDTEPAALTGAADAERRLNELCSYAAADGVPAQAHLRLGDPAKGLHDAIVQLRPDLVLVGSRGQGKVMRALFGSVSDSLWKRSPVPVVVIPAIENAAQPVAAPELHVEPAVGHALGQEDDGASCGSDANTASAFSVSAPGGRPTDVNPELRVRY